MLDRKQEEILRIKKKLKKIKNTLILLPCRCCHDIICGRCKILCMVGSETFKEIDE